MWLVGILVNATNEHRLDTTLTSLRKAGFHEVCVFAEPGMQLRSYDDVCMFQSEEQLGDWNNCRAAIHQLAIMESFHKDFAIIVESGYVFWGHLAKYVEISMSKVKKIPLLGFIGQPNRTDLGSANLPWGWHRISNRFEPADQMSMVMTTRGLASLDYYLPRDANALANVFQSRSIPITSSQLIAQMGCGRFKIDAVLHTPSLSAYVDRSVKQKTTDFVGCDTLLDNEVLELQTDVIYDSTLLS